MGIDHVVVRQKDAAQTPSKNMETKFQSIKKFVEDWLPFTKVPIYLFGIYLLEPKIFVLRWTFSFGLWPICICIFFLNSYIDFGWHHLCRLYIGTDCVFFAEKDSNWREHKNLTKIMPKMQNFIIQPDQSKRVNWIVLARKRSIKCNSYSGRTNQRALKDW